MCAMCAMCVRCVSVSLDLWQVAAGWLVYFDVVPCRSLGHSCQPGGWAGVVAGEQASGLAGWQAGLRRAGRLGGDSLAGRGTYCAGRGGPRQGGSRSSGGTGGEGVRGRKEQSGSTWLFFCAEE